VPSVGPTPTASAREPSALAPDLGEVAGCDAGAQPEPRPMNGLDTHPFAGTRVLVVDDDFRNVFALSALLERGDADVSTAESGSDALAALEGPQHIDIVLMDIMMPGMDGYATIRAIRDQARYQTLPIVAVTGKVVAGEWQRCMDAGANGYVAKPVDTAQLIAAIGPWLPDFDPIRR